MVLTQLPGCTQERVLFHLTNNAFADILEGADLLYRFELALSTKVVTLIDYVATEMQNSGSHYQFAVTPRLAITHHLCLLALTNKGTMGWSDQQIHLVPHRLDGEETISTLATNRHRFAYEKCIDKGNQFIVHLAVSRFPLRHVEGNQLHACIAARIAQIFPKDNEFGADDGSWCESEGEQ